jgi:hypothetical protein
MKLSKIVLIAMIGFSAVFLVAPGTFASSNGLKETSNETVVDGVVESDEYSYSREFKDATLYINWSDGKVYLAVKAKTIGWVGVGFGSSKMNSSYILIGYVDKGKPVFKEQVGKGQSHRDADTKYVQSYKLKEEKGETILELVFNESDIIQGGQQKIDFIMAYGKKDSLTQYHGGTRDGFSVDIVN